MEKQEEIWRDVIGYEGIYRISSFGRVKSLKGGNEKILKGSKTGFGYFRVELFKNGVGKYFKVHQLVAKAFIINNLNKKCINHINGIKTDNNLLNLEYCTYSENSKHAFRLGLVKPPMKGKFGKDNHSSKAVLQFSKSGEFINKYGSCLEATRNTSIRQSSISLALTGKYKSAGGFVWKYDLPTLPTK